MRTAITGIVLAVALALTCGRAWAEDEAADGDAKAAAATTEKPAERPAAAPLVCTVTDVQRSVMWQLGQDAKPQPMKVGDKLPLGADICTGLRSSCRLVFNDDAAVVEVNPMSTVRIGEFSREGDKVRTRIYLKQGTVEADVEPTRFASDFAVVSPEATLAVLGTEGIVATQHRDKGFRSRLRARGRISVRRNNQAGPGQQLRPGDEVGPDMAPPIQTLHRGRLVGLYLLNGQTPGEIYSSSRNGQSWFGPGQGFGPGGRKNMGAWAVRRSFAQEFTTKFYRNHPERLPNYTPPPSNGCFDPYGW
jgi:hypothetical protein